MSKIDGKTPIPFSVMSGDGESFGVGEKSYTVKPMLVGDALKFAEDGLFIDVQLFNLGNKKAKAKLDEYLSRYCTDENNEPMSIEKITADNWNVVHLKQFVKKLVDISG
ncbi:hypothetical protein CLHUN_02110 [Ruminiclostridium hungatei]|uniref:Uncharacterized protein n=1 Tax=Ruminiclostridium hungatei TaxID=48256 RepID=A0A1V4SSH1_RUMHU|nr:hypothetical protein [Ruminiclostridium hungatei]OPX46395.1 hypothetical protein CLHUN_02110 [Ruminiclostridium hungatei]